MVQFLISYIIPLVAPAILAFRHLFSGSLATWGDAPFFYKEVLKELVAEPAAWVERGLAFGGINNLVWISPLMALYGLIGNNDLAVRLLFYLPSILFAGFGTFFLSKYLKLSRVAVFFSVLIYLLNTYYLLVIDGGQVGIALAYGIFPLALLFLKKFLEVPKVKTFFCALGFSFLLSVADPRVAIICIVSAALWVLYEGKLKKFVYFIPLVIALGGLSMYWLYPFIKNGAQSLSTIPPTVYPKWYHPLTLLAPNWPENIFGKISTFNPYFLGVSLLVLTGAFLKRTKTSVILFLLFVTFCVLSAGAFPFEKIPLGFIFRDLTKFFIPVVLFAAILIGRVLESLRSKFFIVVVYAYLLFLVYPALVGNLNFVLSGRQEKGGFQKIYQNLKEEGSSFRTVWFSERHPLAFETQEAPATDGRDLVRFHPFAEMNVGEDPFNFLNNSAFIDWFRILGIKYLVLSGNPREINKDENETRNWQEITKLVERDTNLERLNWGTDIPVYKVGGIYPRFFAVKSLTAVVGTLPADSYPHANTVFFEDGKLDPTLLEGKPAESVEVVFNNKDRSDLAMSFLQKYFVSPAEAVKSQWAVYSAREYLKYKYELLVRGVAFDDFDYGQGITFSTIPGEKAEYKFDVPEAGDHVLAVRSMVPAKGQADLGWEFSDLSLPKGAYGHSVQNEDNLKILNVVALVPKKEYEAAFAKADVFTKHFKVVDKASLQKEIDYREVALMKTGTLNYDFVTPAGYRWVILTDNYHPLWKLRKGMQYLSGIPAFSMANAFYVDEEWTDYGLVFKGQTNVRWGIYWSVASILVLTVIYLRYSDKKYV